MEKYSLLDRLNAQVFSISHYIPCKYNKTIKYRRWHTGVAVYQKNTLVKMPKKILGGKGSKEEERKMFFSDIETYCTNL